MIRTPLSSSMTSPQILAKLEGVVNLVNFKGPYGYKTFCFVRRDGNQVHKFIPPHIWGLMTVFGILVIYMVRCIW